MHYKNGREAHVGDPVVGVGYNHKEMIAGTLVGITPGATSCNCRVLINTTYAVEKSPRETALFVCQSMEGGSPVLVQQQTEYSQCDFLMHATDAMQIIDAAMNQEGNH